MKKWLRNRKTGIGVFLGRILISPKLVSRNLIGKDPPGCRCTGLYLEDLGVFPFTLVRDKVAGQNRGQTLQVRRIVPCLTVRGI